VTDRHIQRHETLLRTLRRDTDAAERAVRQLVGASRASLRSLF
jgi:hypothetical protein